MIHRYPRYACKACEGSGDEGRPPVVTAPREPMLIAKGMLTVRFIAAILVHKFCEALPFHRQEKIYARQGVNLPRATMARYAMDIVRKYHLLDEALRHEAIAGGVVNIDETTVQVLREPGRSASAESRMWTLVGGPSPGRPVVYFHYAQSRESEVAKKLLDGFKGFVQADGYAGYNFLKTMDGVTLVRCIVHVRREFTNILKTNARAPIASEAVEFARR